MLNLFNKSEMKDVFSEIEGSENKLRKQKAFKQLEIYSGEQAKYIYYKIQQMYGEEALKTIQAVTSINIAGRIADAEASIYKEAPDRYYTNASERELDQIAYHQASIDIDNKLMYANRLYRLGNQCQLQIIPKNGKLIGRVLYQHQYDVVPLSSDPNSPEVYIIPMVADKYDRQDLYNLSDNINQRIADANDADLARNKYIVWSDEFNFMCNGLGEILSPEEEIENELKRLPFVDISKQKTMGFYVGGGSELSDFSVAFGVMLSDLGEIVKLQGYSQGVLSSMEKPESLSVGPHRALWLRKDKNEPGDKDPSFQFVSPSPDLTGSMGYAENVLRMFLTSRGSDSKLITTQGTKEFTSGFERLLAMVDRTEATKGDKNLFYKVEDEAFGLIKDWNNLMHQTTEGILPEGRISMIGDSVEQSVKFYEPSQVMTQQEKESSIITRLDNGLMTKKMAVKELYDVDDEKADEMLAELSGGETSNGSGI